MLVEAAIHTDPEADPAASQTHLETALSQPDYYFDREFSWIEFNNRILHEAFDPRTPLLERLNFMAIFCSNLDEFFMVRVAALKQSEKQFENQPEAKATLTDSLMAIAERLRPMVEQHQRHFQQALCPQLAAQGIEICSHDSLQPEQQAYLAQYFSETIFPVLTPLAIDASHPFPYIANLSLNLAVVVQDGQTGAQRFARVAVPELLPRFVPLPAELTEAPRSRRRKPIWTAVPIEQVIAQHLPLLFYGMTVQAHYAFRITRNAEVELEDEPVDLLRAVEQELRRRRVGATAVRLEIEATAPAWIRRSLMRALGLSEADIYDVQGLLDLRALRVLVALPLPRLKYPPWNPPVPSRLRSIQPGSMAEQLCPSSEDIFSLIRQGDQLLHHPYDSFPASVQLFLATAATDPQVLAIKMTLYRTTDSPILDSLIAAAENGKQVAVLVELQARFDEANNILWARRLEQAGVHVVHGLVGLKTHAKVILVVRREGQELKRYVHLGTGDYNPKTAAFCTDVGLLSCREALGADLSELFNYLTGHSRQRQYRELLVAPVNLRQQLIELIQREAAAAKAGDPARIVAKLGALVDPQLIAALYTASQAGVKIDLIIQNICTLRPQLPGISDNICVISLVGRFLEHSRILYFHNRGASETYIGSADWMTRSLNRRVEVMAPVRDPALSQDLQEILGILLADNRHAWELRPTGRYVQRRPRAVRSEINAQRLFMEAALEAEG
ncbi:MAG: polyphosphate kinase 1 [Pegethrix bostrychoides GSE-TBD4-15B]|jgi:polyphosphate kinase|uniref:Polyphosphate kinase n=1 Tax=Pegethrix bostrychoides GSE-TBD4-15B TaxID=2839662 RepID=A0A951U5G3_9CYAN|nr:polyphosphate kinase 1 [Pegethrix bostrychoides GSE-TBD4-15B]